MMEEVELQQNNLEVRQILTSSKADTGRGMKVKFVPNVGFDELKKADLGFLAYGDFVPSNFHLDLVTLLPSVKVGGSIACMVSCDQEVSPTILSFLKFTVTSDDRPVTTKISSSSLQFSFPLPSSGQYCVSAKLYDQHVQGSPLTLPVAVCALPGLAQLGLAPLHTGAVPVKEECDVSSTDDVGIQASIEKKTESGKVAMKQIEANSLLLVPGYLCVAKWSEDGIWYNARVDKVEDRQVEVTFIDYGNVEKICTDKIVKCRAEVPIGDIIDEFVVEEEIAQDNIELVDISMGDLVVAKWNEDDVWYNARVVEVTGDKVEVTFVDYGNSDIVERNRIVTSSLEVPKGDEVDENVVDVASLEIKLGTNDDDDAAKEVQIVNEIEFLPGDLVVAKWEEDGVWYNAMVEALVDEGYSLLFTDYGNAAIAKKNRVFKNASDIPAKETIDECVNLDTSSSEVVQLSETVPASRWSKGSVCIARWSDDGVWYNAVVDCVSDTIPGQYHVTFTDYGNSDEVTEDFIVATAADIPADQHEMVDECVDIIVIEHNPTNSSPPCVEEDARDIDGLQVPIKTSSSQNWSVGTSCIARWSDDGCWYNAVVDGVGEVHGQYKVTFTDYGNSDTVTADSIVTTAADIPADQLDMVDECVQLPDKQQSPSSSPEDSKSSLHSAIEEKPLQIASDQPGCKENKNISTVQPSWKVGDACIAQWSEDDVWYNSEILQVLQEGFRVKFSDYGNEDTVKG